MTQEEKQILLKDICARLPYGVKLSNGLKLRSIDTLTQIVSCSGSDKKIDCIKPYLRSMSSMTKEETEEYKQFLEDIEGYAYSIDCIPQIDWLNAHHFDFRGLIKKGLALEAPEGMYKNAK